MVRNISLPLTFAICLMAGCVSEPKETACSKKDTVNITPETWTGTPPDCNCCIIHFSKGNYQFK